MNPAFERISGYTFHEVAGKNPRILDIGKTRPYHFQLLWQETGNGRVWRGQFINRKKEGLNSFFPWQQVLRNRNLINVT